MSYYDPRTKQVVIAPGASLYERLHEEAHKQQHSERFFGVIMALRWIRGLNYLATLAIEYDALRRARAVMRKLNLWTPESQQQAQRCFLTYVRLKEK